MIGRFSELGVYQELFRLKDFYLAVSAAAKQVGDTILAGTLNHNGVIKAKATKVGKDTTLGKVINLVSEAEMHRPEAVRLIDRYATWFTPVILTCAAVAWIFTGDISRAVDVLIVGCPCALILAAPTATVAALGRSAKAGILIKGGQYLERVAAVKAVLFDKTGTLTLGKLGGFNHVGKFSLNLPLIEHA